MTDATEQAMEAISGGILFCIAVTIVLLLHSTYLQGVKEIQNPEQKVILYEEESTWRH